LGAEILVKWQARRRSRVQDCVVCGEEAQLFVNGQAVCLKCRRRRNNPDDLWAIVTAAKAEHKELSDQFDALNREIVAGTHGIPYPDSTHRVEILGSQAREAFQKYQRAMAAYLEALKRS